MQYNYDTYASVIITPTMFLAVFFLLLWGGIFFSRKKLFSVPETQGKLQFAFFIARITAAVGCLLFFLFFLAVSLPLIGPIVKDKDETPLCTRGIITQMRDAPDIHRYAVDSGKSPACLLTVEGEEFYMPAAAEIGVGKDVLLYYLPNSHVVVECRILGDSEHPYQGIYRAANSVVSYESPNAYGNQDNRLFLMETDDYGRNLYLWIDGSGQSENGYFNTALLLLQEGGTDTAAFYDVCCMVTAQMQPFPEESSLSEQAEDPKQAEVLRNMINRTFSQSVLATLKKENDWNCPERMQTIQTIALD